MSHMTPFVRFNSDDQMAATDAGSVNETLDNSSQHLYALTTGSRGVSATAHRHSVT
ncbi:MAG: hypothetical protein M3014_13760 [Chloroflexota bacterium]|nr:hypothetical protein [Chloroflexota bacterium]